MPIGIIYSIQDAKGVKSSTTINIPSATSFTDAQEFAMTIAQLFANMVTGKVVSVGVHYSLDVSGLAGNAIDPNSDVEEGGKFSWITAGNFRASNRIPTFNEAKIVSGTKQIDLADADVAQFVDYMTNGYQAASTNFVLPVDYRNADIEDVVSALEDFVTSRKLRNV